jgi:hypothetical protein
MLDFITQHLITSVTKVIKEKQKILKHNGFLYFDKTISDGKKEINRVNENNPYGKEEILPLSWYFIRPATLAKIYLDLKFNNFYIYKEIDGKSHKMRIKNRK